jgi:hypothetical protein
LFHRTTCQTCVWHPPESGVQVLAFQCVARSGIVSLSSIRKGIASLTETNIAREDTIF